MVLVNGIEKTFTITYAIFDTYTLDPGPWLIYWNIQELIANQLN